MENKDHKTGNEMAKYIIEQDRIIEKLTERLENYSNNLTEIGMRSQMYCEQQENRANKAEMENEILIAENNRLIKELCGDAAEEVKKKVVNIVTKGILTMII